ncbi:hypothetical protein [Herbiconiux liangxiaofengii]|uniref:hypothetical protein n=1 Tax=Herbiconiux liangxiaofengii TaxID=3342795 RepID=UPI0035B84390
MDYSAAFDDLSRALLADPDDDVSVEGQTLLVKGVAFAVVVGDDLVVDLPAARAADLIGRDEARGAEGPAPAKGRWVAVADRQNWGELASEAHQFVGEPAVGGDS